MPSVALMLTTYLLGLGIPTLPVNRTTGTFSVLHSSQLHAPDMLTTHLFRWIQYLYVPLTFISVGQPWSWRQLFTYAAISPLNMNMLFAASTNFTERVTASKYPAYAAYQARVDMFWPTPLRAWLLTRFRGAAYVQKLDDEIWGKKGSPSEQQPLLDNSLTASSYGAEQETPTFG